MYRPAQAPTARAARVHPAARPHAIRADPARHAACSTGAHAPSRLALLVLLGSPISIAHAQSEQLGSPIATAPAPSAQLGSRISIWSPHSEEDIDPATLAVLHDPPRLQLRVPVVEADLASTEQQLAALDRGPWRAAVGIGIALAAVGAIAEVISLFALAFSELGSGIGCGIDRLRSRPCSDPPTPTWIIATAIAGAPVFLGGLVTLIAGAVQLRSINREQRRLERRRDGRLRELDLLRSVEVQASGDSVVLGASGTF